MAKLSKHVNFRHGSEVGCSGRNLTKRTMIEDITGKTMPALTVFAMAILYLKQHLMGTITDRFGITVEDVYFILTVPAIWGDSAKQFMEEAAKEAGIDRANLELALEPEAASIYCQLNPTKMYEGKGLDVEAGTRYMIVDLGGGTVDITCHEKQIDNSLKEVAKASGGAWGGLKVNENCLNILIEIFGQAVVDRFRQEETADYLELSREFEIRKREISPTNKGYEMIRMPGSFKELYENMANQKVHDAIVKAGFEGKLSWVRDKLKIKTDIIREFFSPSIESTVQQIQRLLEEKDMKSLTGILLVGGFSECKIVQDAVRSNFAEIPTMIPFEAGLTVLKGAVCYGQRPSISSRILRYTYGVGKSFIFDPAKHPLRSKFKDRKEGVDRCQNCFDIIKPINSSVYIGERVEKACTPFSNSTSYQTITLYTSNIENPVLTTGEGCEKIGELTVYLPEYIGKTRVIKESYIFGETQLKAEAVEQKSGEKYETYLNLL